MFPFMSYVCYNFIYTGAPAMVPNVTIDLTSVNINRNNNNVKFRLNWDEPFSNFDPIVNYNIVMSCTDNTLNVCPMMFTTNITTLHVNLFTDFSIMNHTISVTASNTVGTSKATTRIIAGELLSYYLYCYNNNSMLLHAALIDNYTRSIDMVK